MTIPPATQNPPLIRTLKADFSIAACRNMEKLTVGRPEKPHILHLHGSKGCGVGGELLHSGRYYPENTI